MQTIEYLNLKDYEPLLFVIAGGERIQCTFVMHCNVLLMVECLGS